MLLLKNMKTNIVEKYECSGITALLIYNNALRMLDEKEYSKIGTYKDYEKNIKDCMSKIEDYIPLFDIFSEKMFMINKHNVYNRVMNENYRIINFELVDKLIGENDDKKYTNLINFMTKYYNFKKLEKTYMMLFYKYSNNVGKNITVCKRPSFLSIFSHIKPYYTRSEIINMALNMGLIKPDNKTYYDEKLLNKLCEKVVQNDISSNILLEHRSYIIESKYVSLIQHYSLNGSYFMNTYLRNLDKTEYYNEMLHHNIKKLWNVIKKCPVFDKEYILYRFVTDDSYISNLNTGDIFIDKGFMSTTRDPFYKSNEYKFGFILIKIKIPKSISLRLSQKSNIDINLKEGIIK